MKQQRKGGFTLIEIMVVIGIVALISSITFGAFRSVTAGNSRTSCQSNLSQIYRSCRLYVQDYDGRYPYYNPGVAPNSGSNMVGDATPSDGIGLWTLYTFRKPLDSNCSNSPQDVDLPLDNSESASPGLTGYVKSTKIFHCPADHYDKAINYRKSDGTCTPTTLPSSEQTFTPNAANTNQLNSGFMSYMDTDEVSYAPTTTYSSFRGDETTAMPPSEYKRQLTSFTGTTATTTKVLARPTDDTTVITWCRYHRPLTASSGSLTTTPNRSDFDNVLFSDGTVENLPASQSVSTTTGTSGTCTGWKRVPREKADSMLDAIKCIPSP